MKTQRNYASLLRWALHNNDQRRASIIAGAIIGGYELVSSDIG